MPKAAALGAGGANGAEDSLQCPATCRRTASHYAAIVAARQASCNHSHDRCAHAGRLVPQINQNIAVTSKRAGLTDRRGRRRTHPVIHHPLALVYNKAAKRPPGTTTPCSWQASPGASIHGRNTIIRTRPRRPTGTSLALDPSTSIPVPCKRGNTHRALLQLNRPFLCCGARTALTGPPISSTSTARYIPNRLTVLSAPPSGLHTAPQLHARFMHTRQSPCRQHRCGRSLARLRMRIQ